MIIEERKMIFIHIPKNAGTSIKSIFSKKVEKPFKHDTIYSIKKEYPDIYNSYKKFAIVRNPYDRMVSWYSYLRGYSLDNDRIKTYQWDEKKGSYDVIDIVKSDVKGFREWIKDPFVPTKRLLDNQCCWVDETVKILKYENLENELNSFLNENIKLPFLNKTSRDDMLKYYDEESLARVYKVYKKDFKQFNYDNRGI